MLTDDATTDDDDLCRRHAGNATDEETGAAVRCLEVVGGRLHGHAAGDLRHRREQWKPALVVGDGFVGDARGAAVDEILGLVGVGGEVQIGEEGLVFAEHGALDGLRLLDLDDHLGRGEHGLGGVADLGAGVAVVIVARTDAATGGRLDEHLVTATGQLADTGRGQSDPTLVVLDFLRNTDVHVQAPLWAWARVTRELMECNVREVACKVFANHPGNHPSRAVLIPSTSTIAVDFPAHGTRFD